MSNWVEGVLYPYDDTRGMVGDCFKLMRSSFEERKAVVAIGYEHAPQKLRWIRR